MPFRGTPTILIVDDEPAILDALEDLLEEDFRVLKATSGAEGLDLLRGNTVSVVLSDQKMPGMKGEEFLAKVAEGHVTTRVLLTGYTDFEDLVRAVNRGHIYAFVSKPWSPHQLRSLVKAAAERFNLERELLHEKTLLGLLLENIPDLISIKDKDGRYLRLNSACARALGEENPKALIGKTDQELGGSLFQKASEREKAILQGAPPDTDLTEKAARGPQWYSTTRVATTSAEGPPLLIGISREITERLEINRKLEKHAEQMERLNQELSRFSFIVAHHLQEPLRTIGSFTDLLRRRALLKEGGDEYLSYILDSVTRAKSLMRDFSMYLDLHYGAERGRVNLAQACEKAVTALAAPDSDAPRVEIEGEASILGHEELLIQLFKALLHNATTHGGSEQEIQVRLSEPDEGGVKAVVSDQGPGIPEEAHQRVFRLFETLETGSRTGLGLALCQKIVELHGGKIWLENRPGGGLEVHFTLTESEALPPRSGDTGREPLLPETGRDTEPSTDPNLSELGQLRHELERSKAFSAVAAHDLQEPLRMISSYLKLLERREGAQLSDDGREYLHFAVDGAQRMKALLDGLMSYAVSGNHGHGDAERPIQEVLDEVLDDFRLSITEHRAEVRTEALTDTLIGGLRGRQLLYNLLGNALKYRTAEPPRISVSARDEGGETVVTVADNGPGIPAETAAQMFEPFVRGQDPTLAKGAGLGLATCRNIVTGWGGRIWAEPNPNGGTQMRFTLPKQGEAP